MKRSRLRKRYGRAVRSRLKFEKTGTQNRKPTYSAIGYDSIDGGPTTYHMFNEHGMWRLSGDNVRRIGGYMAHDVASVRRMASKIDEAAEKAHRGGYSLTGDVV